MPNEPCRTPPLPVRIRTRPAVIPVVADPIIEQKPAASPQSGDPLASPPAEGAAPASPARSGDYKVGYARPPRQSQFKPGRSGNPKGRPKQAQSFHAIVRKRLLETVQLRTGTGIERVSRAEALFMKTIELGGKGQLRALEKLFALYAAAVPEPQDASGSSAPPDPVEQSAADRAILGMLRAETAAALRSEAEARKSGAPDGEDDHA